MSRFNFMSSPRLPHCICCICFVLFSGCATILERGQEEILLHCVPRNGVTVVANGQEIDFTGDAIVLDKRRKTHFVTVGKEGYLDRTISFSRDIDPFWMLADLLWGPAFPIAWLVDWGSASIYTITPRDLNITLRENQ